jgi:hypothetical protein
MYVICVRLRIVVSNTYCVVFSFLRFVYPIQFLWIVSFLLPLRYSLTFILIVFKSLSLFLSTLWSLFILKEWHKTDLTIYLCWPVCFTKESGIVSIQLSSMNSVIILAQGEAENYIQCSDWMIVEGLNSSSILLYVFRLGCYKSIKVSN